MGNKQRRPFSNKKRAPKDIADFVKRHGFKRAVIGGRVFSNSEALGIIRSAESQGTNFDSAEKYLAEWLRRQLLLRNRARKGIPEIDAETGFEKKRVSVGRKIGAAMNGIRNLAGPAGGEGVRFIFPLVGAAGVGEFMKGALKVLAPKARVTFLTTPKAFGSGWSPSTRAEIVRMNLRKSVTQADRKIVVVDDTETGKTTAGSIQDALKRLSFGGEVSPRNREVYDHCMALLEHFNVGHESSADRRGLGWVKMMEGTMAMDSGNALNYSRKNPYFDENLRQARSGEKPDLESNPRKMTREHNRARREAYNLGIAAARTYLNMRGKK